MLNLQNKCCFDSIKRINKNMLLACLHQWTLLFPDRTKEISVCICLSAVINFNRCLLFNVVLNPVLCSMFKLFMNLFLHLYSALVVFNVYRAVENTKNITKK